MKVLFTFLIFYHAVFTPQTSIAVEKTSTDDKRNKILELIEFSISKGVPQFNRGNFEACEAIYKSSALAICNLGSDNLDREILNYLQQTLSNTAKLKNSEKNSWSLRRALDETYNSLKPENQIKTMNAQKSKIILEANLPKDFPTPGPINEIVVKDYPVYRAAKVEKSQVQNLAFMRLFSHIKSNNIAMTAPVEMNLNEDAERIDMAFLYENTDLGRTGQTNGDVKVLDLPAQKYLSIGILGRETKTSVKSAVKQLEDWLGSQKKYEATGQPRLLGYNSPMVPANKRFWEIQIPVKKVN